MCCSSRSFIFSPCRVPNKKVESVEEFDDQKLTTVLKVPALAYLNSHSESLFYEQKAIGVAKLSESKTIIISMQETRSEKDLRSLWVRQRQCVFGDEKKLKYFKDQEYTYSSCMKECKMDRAMQFCGCLPPFYRPNAMRNLTYCDADSLKCLKDERIWNTTSCNKCYLGCDFTVFSVVNTLSG